MSIKAKNIFFYSQEYDKSTSLHFSGNWQREVLTVHDCKFHHIITLTSAEL